ncbi:uncharacterized protein RB166_014976 [Leptodactylus fuscus]
MVDPFGRSCYFEGRSCIIVRHEDLTCRAKKKGCGGRSERLGIKKGRILRTSKAAEKNPEWIAPFYVTQRCNQLPQEGRMLEKTLIFASISSNAAPVGRKAQIARNTRVKIQEYKNPTQRNVAEEKTSP